MLMKNFTRLIFLSLSFVLTVGTQIYGQCTQGVLYGSGTASTFCTTVTATAGTACHFINEYAKFTGLTIGNTYEIGTNVSGTSTTTPAISGEHMLTLYDGTGAVLTFQANPVNNLTSITFTATTTEVRVQMNTYTGGICGTTGSYCHYYGLRCTSCSGPGAPACPTLTAPANNATGVSTLPTLTWSASTNAVSYDIYLNADATCTITPTTLIATVTGSPYTLTTGLSPTTQYRWMVVPRDCGGSAPASCTPFCFTTTTAPPANDNCNGTNGTPVSLTPQPNAAACSSPVSATTVGATQSNTNCGTTSTNDDVWFTFTATATSEIVRFENVVAVTGMVTAMGMDTYTTCGGTSANCNASLTITSGVAQGTLTGLTVGTTYFLRVWTLGASNSATFNICVIDPPAAPANDECGGAVTLGIQSYAAIGCPGSVPGTTLGATISTVPASATFPSSSDDDVWYQFIASATSHIVRFCNVTYPLGAAVNMGIVLHPGCASGDVEITGTGITVTIASGTGTASLSGLTSGTTYKLRVLTSGTTSRANFDISVLSPPPAPANDDCAGATPFSISAFGGCSYVGVSTSGATQTATPVPSCTGTGNNDDIWHTITPTISGSYTIRYNTLTAVTGTASTVGYDLYTGACASLTAVPLACNAGFGSAGSGSISTPALTAGTTYYLRLWVGAASNSGTWNMCVENPAPPPANDDCAAAIAMPAFTVGGAAATITGTTDAATQSIVGCLGTADDDVWYSFATPSGCNSIAISLTGLIAVSGSSVDMMFEVFSACGGTSLLCSDPESATLTVTPNTTYYIRVYTYFATSRVNFTLNVGASPAMTFTSDASTQPAIAAAAGALDVQIFRLQVTTAGANNPLQMQTINVDMSGGNAANVTAARIYYTTSTTFSTATQFGSTVTNPAATFAVTGTQTLASGSGNYFWVVYDLSCSVSGTIDAAVPTYVLSSITRIPAITNPGTAITPTVLATFATAANGNWSNPATWACGIPPNGTTISVVINHNITLDVPVNIDANFTINAGKTLTINGNTLTIGVTGGDNNALTVNGTLSISAGTLNLNGSGTFNAGAVFNMSGGDFNIDGNTGTAATSVVTGSSLLSIATSSVSITGGIILFVDPHLNNLTGSSAFNYTGSAAVVCIGGLFRFGDGVSTTAGNSTTTGFYLSPSSSLSTKFSFYNLEVNGGSTATRLTRNNWDLVVRNNLTITTGSTLSTNDDVWLLKDLVNNGTFINSAYYTIFGALNSTSVATASPTSSVNTITGNGVYNNATSSATANIFALKIDNNSGNPVSLPASMTSGVASSSISSALLLLNGVLDVSTPVTLGVSGASATTAGTLTHTNGWLNGTLIRWINALAGVRDFPIGTAMTKRLAQINFTGVPSAHTLTASFTASAPGTTGLPVTTQGITATHVSPTGYWTIDANVGQTAAYTATVNAAGFTKTDGLTTITDFPNIRLIKRPTGGAWASFTSSTVAGPGSLTAVSAAGLAGFSQFAIGGTAAALPLELKSFTGRIEGSMNKLAWETLTEKNVQFHSVERSVDGLQWSEVGRTPSQGDAQVLQVYTLEDRAPLAKAYYRLRSVDFDGQESKSNTILLTRKSEHFTITSVFPSPTVDNVTVQFNATREETVTIRVTDMTGRLVLTQTADAVPDINERPLQLTGLQSGMYTVTVANSAGVTAPVRFVKQ